MSLATKFDQLFYLSQNPDVVQAVLENNFLHGLHHFELFGASELRAPNALFSPVYYLAQNPDVAAAVNVGAFSSGFHHYQVFGEVENRVPNIEFEGFDPVKYLASNPDVAQSALDVSFISALHHFIDFGRSEGRLGSGINSSIFTLTSGIDHLEGTLGADTFFASPETLQEGDFVDGMAGEDILSFSLISDDDDTFNEFLPILSTFSNLETISVTAKSHKTSDFSGFVEVQNIKLNSGKTLLGSMTDVTLSADQSLYLNNIKDGDDGTSDLSNGGLRIMQPGSKKELDLTLDDFGASEKIENESIFIDIAGKGVERLDITSIDISFINLENSGGKLASLNLVGAGVVGILQMPTTIETIDARSSSADLTLSTDALGASVLTNAGDDTITLTGGQSAVETGDDNDIVYVVSGTNHDISTGSGNDIVDLLDGVNIVAMGAGNDEVIIRGGTNRIELGNGVGQARISAGTNVVTSGDGADVITVAGGNNTLNTGSGNDTITLTSGENSVILGDGDDTITASGGVNNIDFSKLEAGAGTDTLKIISTGTVTLPTFSDFEQIFISEPVHQSHNFSLSTTLTEVGLESGTTIDGQTITTTLGAGQSLKLDGITDGDTAAASLADGGIIIAQASSITSLNLTLDDVGPASSITNENVFIDIAGAGVANATVTSGNDSFVVISNSGGALTNLELLGTGSMALGTLPTSITNINGAAASANLTLTIGTGVNTFRGGVGNDAITITGGINDIQTGDGDDIISTANNLVAGDRIDGGNGSDTFEVIHTGLATIPSTANLISIENISIQDTVHQSLDFSMLTSITGIELDSGTTVDGATINTTLGAGQSLKLDSITDGDTAAASLADGGIKVIQPNSSTSIDLTLDDIGPASSSTNENVFIDIAGANVANLNITSANDSFVVLENSGASISTIDIEGSGTLSLIGALPNSITTIDAGTSSTSLTVSTGTAGATITGGSGNDVIVLGGGNNNVNSGNGSDTITLSTGNDTVNTGSGSDTVTASSGTNNITTGASGDQITLSGGSNTVNSGASNDQLTISGGTNNIDTESGNDQITISGGNNTLTTGNNNDTISASNGVNNINTGSGTDQVTLTGGTNTVVTGNNDDTLNVSGGNNDIDTDAGSDQVVLTGGTNDVNTGANDDTITLSGGTETVDMGSGNDTVEAGANLSTSDTVNGGDGTGDSIEVTSALTDALTARLSNFEILEIKGGGGLTHDITGLTGLTSLKASGALTGAVVITDLAEAAEVDISAALGNDLTINQINSAGGADTLTFDFSGSSLTTGGSIIAPNIETVTLKTSASGAKTISGATFADATNVTITATGSNLVINDFTATNITALDASSSNKIVTITTGADVFSSAFTFSGSSTNDRLDFDGATLVAGTVFELGQGGQDTLTLNADAVATVVRTSATTSNRAISIRDDATSTDTASFTSGSDTFDYNGSLSHDSVTSVVATSGATLQAAVAADADATVYVIQDADGDADLETAINNFADNVGRGRANTLESEAVDTGLLSYTGLDAAFGSSDIVLIAIDSETNEEGSTANNGGTAVYRFQNSDTSTVDTVLSSELELIGVFQDAALGTVDFV